MMIKYKVFISSLLYSFYFSYVILTDISWNTLIWFITIPQAIISLSFCNFNKSDYPKTMIFMGILDGLITIIPLVLSLYNFLDYGHVLILKIASIIFSVIHSWRTVKPKVILKSFLTSISILLSSIAVYESNHWPNMNYGILLGLLSAFFASYLGQLQKYTNWKPNGLLKLSQCVFIIIIALFSAKFEKERFDYNIIILWVLYGIQTYYINEYIYHTRNTYELALILGLKKSFTICISTNWFYLLSFKYILAILLSTFVLIQ